MGNCVPCSGHQIEHDSTKFCASCQHEDDSAKFCAFQRFSIPESKHSLLMHASESKSWVLESFDLDFFINPRDEKSIQRTFDAVDVDEPFGSLEKKELFRWFELEYEKQDFKLSPQRQQLVNDICEISPGDVTFEKFNGFFKTWSEEAKRNYCSEVAKTVVKDNVVCSCSGDKFEMTFKVDIRNKTRPTISTIYHFSYNGFVTKSTGREYILNLERIRWDSTRRNNSRMLRTIQKRTHHATCTILNLKWRMHEEIQKYTELPESLMSLVMEYCTDQRRYGSGSLLFTTKGLHHKTQVLAVDDEYFNISVKATKEGRLLATLLSPCRFLPVLTAAASKDLNPLHIVRKPRKIVLDLSHDDILSNY
mmetsp:Transcript_9453/g.15289  ORF Transcript_9453/g.15289 Transcript_9453/m.15289 type:complete len:364 (-) Transcript_9453:286-1377(-)|eukprot:jgi/Bigna1/84987/estExt_fgenesh1_pg.C_10539